WDCPCGAAHDRDVNAALNVLAAGQADNSNDRGARVRPGFVPAPRGEAVTHPDAACSTRSVEGTSVLQGGEDANHDLLSRRPQRLPRALVTAGSSVQLWLVTLRLLSRRLVVGADRPHVSGSMRNGTLSMIARWCSGMKSHTVIRGGVPAHFLVHFLPVPGGTDGHPGRAGSE
ncbi:MAG: transposase, partial [Dactylosporangium sp.]|nr:transposase [Dactylosporangium sp.]